MSKSTLTQLTMSVVVTEVAVVLSLVMAVVMAVGVVVTRKTGQ